MRWFNKIFWQQKGQVIVLYAVFLTGFMGVTSLAVDVGYLYMGKAALQSALDSAALAGGSGLPDTATAETRAVQFAQTNQVYQQAVTLQSSDIEFGVFQPATDTFTVTGSNITALRITKQISLPLFFGPVLGINAANISALAIVMMSTKITCGALFSGDSNDTMSLSGTSVTDSYNSNFGPYDPANPGSNGHICSNADIDLSGSMTINGSARPGEGKTVTMSGGATVTGPTTPSEDLFLMPMFIHAGCSHPTCLGVTVTEFLNADPSNANGSIGLTSQGNDPLDADNNFNLSGHETLTLTTGDYYFQAFNISGSAGLTIDASGGPVRIYVTASFNVSGDGIVSNPVAPADIRVYITSASATYSGSGDFYGIIYAPNANLTLSTNADFFGAVLGKKVTMSGDAKVHYDEALDTTDFPALSGTGKVKLMK